MEEEEGEEQAVDEAAARRAALLKRYGDRTPPSGPIAVKSKKTNEAGGFDVEKAAAGEVNHNEIWGDCECAVGILYQKIREGADIRST